MTEGCRLMNYNSSHTDCECDHLTHFAVLVDITSVELTAGHKAALAFITYVGCAISMLGLMASIATFTFVPSLKVIIRKIHFQYSLISL
jgi:hypothetical protein